MALVRNNLEEIKAMFTDLELDAFLNEKLEMPAVLVIDLILADQTQFVKRRKRTHDESFANNAEVTLLFNESTKQIDLSSDEVFLYEIDGKNPAVHVFFVGLADYLEKLLQSRKGTVTFEQIQISELVTYFAKIFTKVRRSFLQVSLRKNVAIDELLVISFFIENNGTEEDEFLTIVEKMIADRSRRQSLSQTKSNSFRSDLSPLINLRTFNGPYQIKLEDLRQVVDVAFANFEKVLIKLLRESKDVGPLKGFQWMGKPILRHFSKELRKETFQCSVCFTESLISKSFGCTSINRQNGDSIRHLFCLECVRGQAEASANEALLSEGALGLRCMEQECRNSILFAEISRYLPRQLRLRLDKRITNQTLCSANLSGLEYCLKCDFAMIMEVPKEIDKVYNCQKCRYSFCRLCEEDWAKHFGFSCDKVKENSEEAKRREIEKKLNEAVVRCCPKCRLQFVKLNACNKMTCACGTTQCYICRKVGISYDHFCNHPRDPGKAECNKCAEPKCLLWEDFKRHDREAIDRILKESNVHVNVPVSPMPGTSTQQERVAPVQQQPQAPRVAQFPIPQQPQAVPAPQLPVRFHAQQLNFFPR